MIREQIQFVERPPTDVWEAMHQWLEHHGVRSAVLPAWNLWFDRCEHTRRIRYPEIVSGVDPTPDRVWMRATREVVRTVQLEAAPSPFPALTGARFNYAAIRGPRFAAALTVPPTWPHTAGDAAAVWMGDPPVRLHLGRGSAAIVHDS